VSLFRQNFGFQSNYISVRVTFSQLGPNSDGQKIRKRHTVRKAIPSTFPDFLELKPFLCRITDSQSVQKKLADAGNQLLQSADLWNCEVDGTTII